MHSLQRMSHNRLKEPICPHLGLGVGPEPGQGPVAPQLSQLGVELVGQDDGEGHALLRLIGGVAEHQPLHRERERWSGSPADNPEHPDAAEPHSPAAAEPGTHLVARADVFLVAVDVNTLGNVRRLLLQSHQDIAGLVVKA